VSLIRADLPNAPIEILTGQMRVRDQSIPVLPRRTGVKELMTREPSRAPSALSSAMTSRRTVFGIMPDYDGLAFSVGRRATAWRTFRMRPSEVREFLAHLLDDERDAALP